MGRRMISRLALAQRICFGLGHANTRFQFKRRPPGVSFV
jgi:hypothetical protein